MTQPLDCQPEPDEDIEPNLYTHGDMDKVWRRKVYHHQKWLVQALAKGNDPKPPKRQRTHPLPWTIEDLRHVKQSHVYSSRYRGVLKMRYHRDFFAFVPSSSTGGRKPLGRYATEEEAALVVLYALNPAARSLATPTLERKIP